MASRTPTIVYRGGMHGTGLRYISFTVDDADASDTVTISELDTIKDTIGVRLDTGAEVDCTEATNVVTIGSGPSSTPMYITVTGW